MGRRRPPIKPREIACKSLEKPSDFGFRKRFNGGRNGIRIGPGRIVRRPRPESQILRLKAAQIVRDVEQAANANVRCQQGNVATERRIPTLTGSSLLPYLFRPVSAEPVYCLLHLQAKVNEKSRLLCPAPGKNVPTSRSAKQSRTPHEGRQKRPNPRCLTDHAAIKAGFAEHIDPLVPRAFRLGPKMLNKLLRPRLPVNRVAVELFQPIFSSKQWIQIECQARINALRLYVNGPELIRLPANI